MPRGIPNSPRAPRKPRKASPSSAKGTTTLTEPAPPVQGKAYQVWVEFEGEYTAQTLKKPFATYAEAIRFKNEYRAKNTDVWDIYVKEAND